MSYHHLNLSERGQIEGMLRVGTSKAASVFCDWLGITILDPDHSEEED